LGRWLTADPLDFADGPNLYAYVRNNPLSFVDPDGQFVFAIPLITWGASLAIPSLTTVLTTVAYTAATGVAFYGGYKVAEKYNVSEGPKGSHRKNPRESTRSKHEKADARRQKEQRKAEEKQERNKKRR
ncbi:MAG: RHS repeat-associated core domain-containing protein, partial [Waddliaceae bacterium]